MTTTMNKTQKIKKSEEPRMTRNQWIEAEKAKKRAALKLPERVYSIHLRGSWAKHIAPAIVKSRTVAHEKCTPTFIEFTHDYNNIRRRHIDMKDNTHSGDYSTTEKAVEGFANLVAKEIKLCKGTIAREQAYLQKLEKLAKNPTATAKRLIRAAELERAKNEASK